MLREKRDEEGVLKSSELFWTKKLPDDGGVLIPLSKTNMIGCWRKKVVGTRKAGVCGGQTGQWTSIAIKWNTFSSGALV